MANVPTQISLRHAGRCLFRSQPRQQILEVRSRRDTGMRGRLLLLAAMAALLAAPATASAVTFGADLNQAANNRITCADGVPNQLYPTDGPLSGAPFYDTGQNSCMWTEGGPAQELLAPGSGVVTALKVKVGPVTGPMQVVVIRWLFELVNPPVVGCCTVQQYGPVFTPAANSVSTVSAALNMEQGVLREGNLEIQYYDTLALEVLGPNVPVPAYTATGGLPEDATPDYAWIPAPSAAGVQPGPMSETFAGGTDSVFSGYHVLIAAEMSPSGARPKLIGLPKAVVPPRLAFPKLTLPVRNGSVALPLRCSGARCVGKVILQNIAQPGARIAKGRAREPSLITYGSAPVIVAARAQRTVTVKLDATGKKATEGHRAVKVWANFTFGSTKLSKQITLQGTQPKTPPYRPSR